VGARCNGLDWGVCTMRSEVATCWRLDRLGRSLRHLIELMAELESDRIGFQSVTESIDTTTLGGKLVFPIFGGARGV
jgi:DNA invertase Pin-like site-specific DNA recombinase